MNLIFASEAWEDYLYWQATDRKTVARIHELLKDVRRDPFVGIGKPEPLKHERKGWWSRRISSEHRLIYRITPAGVEIARLRGHY